ncbi:MAG: hypothetical protein WDZ52_07940 [Pseudohongiellaceae bacterium]
MALAQSEQDLNLQKLVILATGSAANASQMAELNGMVTQDGGMGSIDALVDSFINQLVAQQGSVATYKAIAKNGFGVSLTDAQAQDIITQFVAAGINTGSKLLNLLSNVDNVHRATLDNRSEASSEFLASLEDSGKGANFTGQAVTAAVYTLLQNIGISSTSLDNGISGLRALASGVSTANINGTVDSFLAGATVFADTNRDGVLSAGEWTTFTNVNGTFQLPNTAAAGKIIAYGGTDLVTGNAFQGVVSASVGSTIINPVTALVEAMVAAGISGSVMEATASIKAVLALPENINLLSYSPLAVLSSSTATSAEKATALSVHTISQQISNLITQTASVIDNGSADASLQSAGATVSLAIAQAIGVADAAQGTLDLSDVVTLRNIIQVASTATGSSFTSAEVAQIAQVTAGSNASAAAATDFTMLAQAYDVAQGSATNALIAGAISGDFGSAVNAFTGTALNTANYIATVGNIAPGVPTLPTANQQAQPITPPAPSAPTATLTYSIDAGTTTATTASVKDADTLRVIATFNKAVNDGTPTITIDNGILLVASAMTKTDGTHYFYDLNVPAGDIAAATITIGGAEASGLVISAAPTNAVFAVDNTAPSAPTGVALTAVGGTVVADTLNSSNTNMTATAAITAGQATGGTAVLKVGATTIATDSAILAGDTSVTFNLGVASTTALQAAVAAGGVATVTLNDAAGNSAVSAVANPTLVVAYTAPSAPTGVALTSVGGTVITNSLNSSNTNLTAVATIAAGQATGGSAVLKIGSTTIATDATILIADTQVTFDLSTADNTALQAAVAAGGVATVTVTDASGNSTVSTLSNPTLAVDYSGSIVELTVSLTENLSGSGASDIFTGTYGDGAGPYTFNTGDIIDGLGGVDTLNITTGAEASSPPDNLWLNKTNFENVIFNSLGNGAQVITSGAAFEAAFAANGVNLTAQTLLGAIDVNLTTFTGAATITTITTGDGAHTITTGSGVSTVSASGIAAGAQTVNGVGLTTVNATINGAGDQVIGTTNGGNLVTVNANILAAGSQTIQSTSGSNVTIVAAADSGAQTITTAGGNDSITSTGSATASATISSGAGNDTISAGLGNDLITAGTGTDIITGGGGIDTFEFGADGSIVGTALDVITDFNSAGADELIFAAAVALPGIDATLAVAGANVQTSAGGLISFHANDNTLALKVVAIQADAELDLLANTAAIFVDGADTYVYFTGALAGDSVDDQMIELTGISSLTAITGGVTMTIA